MTTMVNVHEAKTHLSRLLAQVEAGEDVVIARDGKPIARLSAVGPPRLEVGFANYGHIPDEVFFEPMTEAELAEWE
jgi:prevent-host-death family protein